MGKRSNLIPITRIYDIYPKYTYSVDVKKFMDEIVDIDRADVYTKDEVIAMLTELRQEIEELEPPKSYSNKYTNAYFGAIAMKEKDKGIIQQKINELKGYALKG